MNEQQEKLQHVVARCWSEPLFAERLKKAPAETLRQAGLQIPEGTTVKVWENSPAQYHLVIPQPPVDLADAELGLAAGGSWGLACRV